MTSSTIKLSIELIEKYLAEETACLHDTNILRQLADCMRELEIEKAKSTVQPYHCDGERVIAWLDNPGRKDARMAFTDSLERQIAYRFEAALRENERLREALGYIDNLENDAPKNNIREFFEFQFATAQNKAEDALASCKHRLDSE